MIRWTRWLAALGATTVLAACGGSDDPAPTVADEAGSRGFNALVAAAGKAGLSAALADRSASLTVFAPTDAAFGSLARSLGFADANAMVQALDAATLAKILQYHILPTRKPAATLAGGSGAEDTLYRFEGKAASLKLSTSGGVRITDAALTQATVTSADVQTDNGVIHAVDKVLVPPGVLNVVQMAQVNPSFSVLVEAVAAARLGATLSGAGPFTVFAPTDAGFVAALAELGLSKPQLLSSSGLGSILTYHVVSGNVRAADVVALPKPATVATVQGGSFSVGADLTLTDALGRSASLVATDVMASNGVIHVIDKVILPAAP